MISLSPEAEFKAFKFVELNEGRRQFLYKDSKGNWTIGVGHNLNLGLPTKIIDDLLSYDMNSCENDLLNHVGVYSELDDMRKIVLLDMRFNCGLDGLLHFKDMIAALGVRDYLAAAHAINNSEIAPLRKARLVNIMETGTL